MDVAVWAVPLGIIGGRLYHVISSPQAYFGEGGHPLNAFKIWEGGLGIWGGLALGILGIWIGCRRNGVRFLDYLDAAAPGVAVAQAMGRFGNYFNNELYGARTDLPWGLQIHCWDQSAGVAVACPGGTTNVLGTFQPTFLYESIWCLLVALALVLVDRRFALAMGQIASLYGMLYTFGRGFIEMLRTDAANHVLRLRLNVWTSVIVFAGSAFAFWRLGARGRTADKPGTGAPPLDEPSVGEPAVGEPAVGEPAVGEPAVGEPAVGEPAVGEPAVGEPEVGEPGMDEPVTGETHSAQHPD